VKRVVERCPTCGVEHDDYAAEGCEACGTALRYWCRAHSREAGWLETPECRRCAEEAVRPTPAPRPRAAPPVHPPLAPMRPPAPARAPELPPRPVRSGSPAWADRDEPVVHVTPQTLLRNIVLVLLAAGVVGGLLAWGEVHPKEAFAAGVVVVVLGMTAAMLHLVVRILGSSRGRGR